MEGSLLSGSASKTVVEGLKDVPLLNHVVAHGAVRWWARPSTPSFNYYEYQPGKVSPRLCLFSRVSKLVMKAIP